MTLQACTAWLRRRKPDPEYRNFGAGQLPGRNPFEARVGIERADGTGAIEFIGVSNWRISTALNFLE